MRREISKWYSPNLNKEMDIVAYGDYGFALLLFPTAAADCNRERARRIRCLTVRRDTHLRCCTATGPRAGAFARTDCRQTQKSAA